MTGGKQLQMFACPVCLQAPSCWGSTEAGLTGLPEADGAGTLNVSWGALCRPSQIEKKEKVAFRRVFLQPCPGRGTKHRG